MTTATDQEILSQRTFDVPRERVFKAWTDPNHLARWWGPKGFRSTFEEFDLKPGGAWRFVMHGPDGVDHPNHSVFEEIVAPERIVFVHLSQHRFRVTAIFTAPAPGKTDLRWTMRFESAAEVDRIKAFVVLANEENLDRLEAELARVP